MAKLTSTVYVSHVPAIGRAIDADITQDSYWKPLFDGFVKSREWMKDNIPDVVILVYNDHANFFDLSLIPTFALGTGPKFTPSDEGWGPRQVPLVEGHPEFAAHLSQSLIQQDFDLTLCSEMEVDHGLTVPLSIMCEKTEKWPFKVIPLHVNVVQYPPPSGQRCFNLGKAIRQAIDSFDEDLNIQVWGTGGMSHQLQGERAGLINQPWDNAFMDRLIDDPAGQAQVPHVEYVREAGSEGVELVMWLIARGAMKDAAQVVHRHYHVPASNTAVGHLILKEDN